MSRWIMLVMLLCGVSQARAEFVVGRFAGEFLSLGAGARAMGMGNGYLALT